MEEKETCLNCGTPLQGAFCYHCGQRRIGPADRTVKYFVIQFFGASFFLENNFLKNLWALLTRPGQQTNDFISGARKKWMPPFSVFLLINLIYFIFTPLSDLDLSLEEQLTQDQHAAIAQAMVNKKIQKENISFEEYSTIYKTQTSKLSSSLIILNVPVLALFLTLLFIRKKMFYADHFIFSLYLFAFVLLIVLIISGIAYFFGALFGLNLYNPGLFLLIGFLIYLFLALRKVYAQKMAMTLLSLVLVTLAFIFTHFFYRSFLFFMTFWST